MVTKLKTTTATFSKPKIVVVTHAITKDSYPDLPHLADPFKVGDTIRVTKTYFRNGEHHYRGYLNSTDTVVDISCAWAKLVDAEIYKGYHIMNPAGSHSALIYRGGDLVKCVAGDIIEEGDTLTHTAVEKAKSYIDNTELSEKLGYKRNVVGLEFETPGNRKFRILGINIFSNKPLLVLDLVNNVTLAMVANKQYIK